MIGGSIREYTIAGRTFTSTEDADTSRKLGGAENAIEHNGDDSVRIIQTRKGWSLAGNVFAVEDSRGDQEFLQDIADKGKPVAISVTFASGDIYQGKGLPTGEIVFSNQKTTCTCDLEGGGKMTRQA